MKPINTVDDAVRAVVYLAGWGIPPEHVRANDLLAGCYTDALKRTEGLVLSRALLLRAWDVLNAHGVLR